MVMVFFREPWYLRRDKYLFSYEVPEFQISELEFQFSDSPDIGIQKIFSDRNLWNQKTELEFHLRWGSQKSESKIGIPNLAHIYRYICTSELGVAPKSKELQRAPKREVLCDSCVKYH